MKNPGHPYIGWPSYLTRIIQEHQTTPLIFERIPFILVIPVKKAVKEDINGCEVALILRDKGSF